MTREARVGLLFGLIFIIAFGMILSEMQGVTDVPSVVDAPPSLVDKSYYQPNPTLQDEYAMGFHAAEAANIHNAYARRGHPQWTRPEERVSGTAAARRTSPVTDRPRQQLTQTDSQDTQRFVRASMDDGLGSFVTAAMRPERRRRPTPSPAGVTGRGETGVADARRAALDETTVARRQPEAPAGFSVLPTRRSQPVQPRQATPPRRLAHRVYVVKSNDNLIKIAKAVYGSDKGHLYTKIHEANRDVMADEGSIYPGQKLKIPALATARTTAQPSGSVAIAQRRRPAVREVDLAGLARHVQQPARRYRVYVVQGGDNLTKIARRTLQDGSRQAVDAIYNANRGTLRSKNQLRSGMRLRIPVVSSN